MRTLLLVIGVGFVVALALGWVPKAWGQVGTVPPFSSSDATLPIPSVTTTAPSGSGPVSRGPILVLPPGSDPELVLRAVEALRGTPAVLPGSAIVSGNANASSGGAIDGSLAGANANQPAPPAPGINLPLPPRPVRKDPPMLNPGPTPRTVSLF